MKTALKNISTITFRKRHIQIPFRFFQQNQPNYTKSLDRIRTTLQKEIEYENGQIIDYSNLFQTLQDQGWQITDYRKSPGVILTKKHDNDSTVTIAFNCVGPEPFKEDFQKMLDEAGIEEQDKENLPEGEKAKPEPTEEELTTLTVDASFYLNRGGKNSVVMQLSIQEESFIVRSCGVTTRPIEEDAKKYLAREYEIQRMTPFTSLDEDVRSAFLEYLTSVGLDKDFCIRVQQLSVAKDHKLYVDFLGNFRDFATVN